MYIVCVVHFVSSKNTGENVSKNQSAIQSNISYTVSYNSTFQDLNPGFAIRSSYSCLSNCALEVLLILLMVGVLSPMTQTTNCLLKSRLSRTISARVRWPCQALSHMFFFSFFLSIRILFSIWVLSLIANSRLLENQNRRHNYHQKIAYNKILYEFP